jgi:hypothetical protein
MPRQEANQEVHLVKRGCLPTLADLPHVLSIDELAKILASLERRPTTMPAGASASAGLSEVGRRMMDSNSLLKSPGSRVTNDTDPSEEDSRVPRDSRGENPHRCPIAVESGSIRHPPKADGSKVASVSGETSSRGDRR